MRFHYEGIEATTKQAVTGEMEAVSQQEVIRWLEEQRIEAVAIQPAEKKAIAGRAVKPNDLVLPLQEMAVLTEQGVTLVDALKALSQNDEHPNLGRGFLEISHQIEGGKNFSAALAESRLPFPSYVAHLLSAGEASGQLALALRNASNQMNYDQSVREDLRGALTYPLVLVSAGIVAMLIIFVSVVPKFTHLLESNQELPVLAKVVLGSGRFVNEFPWVLVGLVILLVGGTITLLANAAIRNFLINVAIEMPIIGPWLSEQDSARWASLCAAMLSAKVSLLIALKMAAESCEYTRRRQRARQMIQDIEQGESFSEAVKRARLIPATSQNLVAVGDQTGQLAAMLSAVAELHDLSCKRRMKRVLQLIEPLAILIVGIFIGVMILGIVQAITASTDIAL